ncbi:MAG: hypothetical protein QUV20_16240, partial [Oceanibaculum nanhaiense]
RTGGGTSPVRLSPSGLSAINGVTQAAQDTGRSSSDLLGTARGLNGQSDALRERVDAFLVNVRAM